MGEGLSRSKGGKGQKEKKKKVNLLSIWLLSFFIGLLFEFLVFSPPFPFKKRKRRENIYYIYWILQEEEVGELFSSTHKEGWTKNKKGKKKGIYLRVDGDHRSSFFFFDFQKVGRVDCCWPRAKLWREPPSA